MPKLIIIILLVSSISTNSSISLKIRGPGIQDIFFGNMTSDNCVDQPLFTPPDEIIINQEKQKNVSYQYNFDLYENNIELIWYRETKITSSACLFYTCEKIKEIDLSNYNSKDSSSTYRMFRDCIELTSIKFGNFNTANVLNFEAMFKNCTSLKKINVSSFDTSKVTSMFRMFYGCTSLKSLDLSNFLTPNLTSITEMFYDCKQLRNINLINAIFPDNLDCVNSFITSKNLVCFTRDEKLISIINNYGCAMTNNNFSDNWKESQKKINTENDSCIDNCAQCSNKYEYESFCYEQCPNGTIPNRNNICFLVKFDEEIKDEDDLVQNVQSFINSGIELSDIDKGNDIEIKNDGITIGITTTGNQKNDKNKNKTIINLKECEDILKDTYNISKNDSLYILKIDIEQKGMKIPKIEYEIYYPLYGNVLIKLNLSYCKNNKIDLLIPANINGNIDKYNSKSDYYNSICSKTDSDNGVDIPLIDRKKIFIEKNLTLCEDNCNFIKYDYDNKKVECSCEIKITLPIIKDVIIDKEKLKRNFIDIKNIININIMKCYKTVLTKRNIKNNYGFFIIIFILLFHYISFFSFYCKYYESLKKLINMITLEKIKSFKSKEQNKSKKKRLLKRK